MITTRKKCYLTSSSDDKKWNCVIFSNVLNFSALYGFIEFLEMITEIPQFFRTEIFAFCDNWIYFCELY